MTVSPAVHSAQRYGHHYRRWVESSRSGDRDSAERHLYALRAHLRNLGWLAPEYDRPGLGVREGSLMSDLVPTVRKMAERWWISVCPECNGRVELESVVQAHNETCPNRHYHRVFAVREVLVMPVAEHEEILAALRAELAIEQHNHSATLELVSGLAAGRNTMADSSERQSRPLRVSSAPEPFYPQGEHKWKPSDEATPMLVRAADRLYEECRRAIVAHRLDARSPIGDAVLDYRQERDEMAALREKPTAFVKRLPSQWAGSGRSPYA